jgi:hypothetical protein
MGIKGEPPALNVEAIIRDSDAIIAAAEPKKIMADPLNPNGVFQKPEPDLGDIKQKIAAQEAEREARILERQATVRANAKRNSPLPSMVDVG